MKQRPRIYYTETDKALITRSIEFERLFSPKETLVKPRSAAIFGHKRTLAKFAY